MKPSTTGGLVVMVFLFGIVATNQYNLAYAATSERITLVQKLEQFPDQEVSGFCNLQQDDEGNVTWRIKVTGLLPQTEGHFDLGHWAGEDDVPYTADEDGNADSKKQNIVLSKVNRGLFAEFAKCKVYLVGNTHFTSPVIALGSSDSENLKSQDDVNQDQLEGNSIEISQDVAFGSSKSNDVNVNQLKQENPKEKKIFIFAALDFLFGIFNNNVDEPSRPDFNFIGPIFQSNHPSSSNAESKHMNSEGKGNSDKDVNKGNDNKPDDKGNENKPGDKGNDNKPGDKGNDNKPSDKENDNKPSNQENDNKPSDQENEAQSNKIDDNDNDSKPSDKGKVENGKSTNSKGNEGKGNGKK